MSGLKTHKRGRAIVSVQLVRDALMDPHIGRGVYELVELAFASLVGQTDDERQCFVCCRPWAPTIEPIAVVVAETIGAHDALVSLICSQCFTGDWTQPLLAALQRDLGFRLEQFVCKPPTGREH